MKNSPFFWKFLKRSPAKNGKRHFYFSQTILPLLLTIAVLAAGLGGGEWMRRTFLSPQQEVTYWEPLPSQDPFLFADGNSITFFPWSQFREEDCTPYIDSFVKDPEETDEGNPLSSFLPMGLTSFLFTWFDANGLEDSFSQEALDMICKELLLDPTTGRYYLPEIQVTSRKNKTFTLSLAFAYTPETYFFNLCYFQCYPQEQTSLSEEEITAGKEKLAKWFQIALKTQENGLNFLSDGINADMLEQARESGDRIWMNLLLLRASTAEYDSAYPFSLYECYPLLDAFSSDYSFLPYEKELLLVFPEFYYAGIYDLSSFALFYDPVSDLFTGFGMI